MPTFTTIALDSLLEPSIRSSTLKTLPPKQEKNSTTVPTAQGQKFPVFCVSPALYTTPESTRIPDSPSLYSTSPSPYVVKYKRRGRRFAETEESEIEIESENVSNANSTNCEEKPDGSCGLTEMGEVERGDGAVNVEIDKVGSPRNLAIGSERVSEFEEFYDPKDAVSVASFSDGEENSGLLRGILKHEPLSCQNEFFDALEDLSSDGSVVQSLHSSNLDLADELRSVRLNLFMETERCKKAEEILSQMRSNWQRVGKQLSQIGLSLPHLDGSEMDLVDDFCQNIVVSRFVSEAIGRAEGLAEAEAAAKEIIESKNREIARLKDKVQYYETVNQEMSQRNQEAVEMSRRLRQRRRKTRRFIWGCISLSLTVGVPFLAYRYYQSSKAPSLIPSSVTHDECESGAKGGLK
ncbi:uncharacterized protein LOC18431351 isoform X1 [Amborella trichopoda]|uniref:uncharacterized protein LOC18431351 isoform X1 n=1 Tax=Amborella trichopoda TaxID=13333 RepID=UPI0005D34F1A|nr:uncharacterized protein LOC18431351 isoform X1 [Amborella trichopoda]|eukprot:XP_006841539.2 uncharacterized protein LOC18431351 isoform X1 [Amborella trichopoda]